jgi:hypothetical protein
VTGVTINNLIKIEDSASDRTPEIDGAHAVELAREGVPSPVIQTQLGHSAGDPVKRTERDRVREAGVSGGEEQAAGCSCDAGLDESCVDQAGVQEDSRAAVEIDDRSGGEQGVEAFCVAEIDDRPGEPSALDGRVERVEDRGDHFVGGVGIVGLDRVEEMLEVWGEQLWQRDRQRKVELRELEEIIEQVAKLVVVETSQLACGLTGLVGKIRAREIVVSGPA